MKTYPLFKVHVPTDEALVKVREVFESGFINEGVQVTALGQELSKKLQTDKLVLMNSCTSALTVALRLCNADPSQRVISTPMTCVATNTPIVTSGAEVLWADVDPLDGMIDVVSVSELLSHSRRLSVAAIMAVAWAGTPPNLLTLRKLADDYGVPLILDAAHAFGATYKGRPVHEWADYTCYSFQAIKHFTTGDGGALVCRTPEGFHRAKCLKWFGMDREASKDEKGNWKGQHWDADIVHAGYKFNMNNVSAAIGLAQVPYIDGIIAKHRHNAARYNAHFSDCYKTVHPIGGETEGSSHWVYTMLIEDPSYSRDKLLLNLNADGIMAGVVHVPNHEYSCFSHSKTPLPGVERFSSRQFSIPCGWWIDQADVNYIASRVKFHLGLEA